jgi:hypothetical protein
LELDIFGVEEKLSIRSGPNFVEELGEEGKLLYGLGLFKVTRISLTLIILLSCR